MVLVLHEAELLSTAHKAQEVHAEVDAAEVEATLPAQWIEVARKRGYACRLSDESVEFGVDRRGWYGEFRQGYAQSNPLLWRGYME